MNDKKRYVVFMQDEWNNFYWIGEFEQLKDAIPQINEWLRPYNVSIDDLNEYASTFGVCFDKEIYVTNEYLSEECVMVRGFILEE